MQSRLASQFNGAIPLTPRGVASFAHRPSHWLAGVQWFASLLVAFAAASFCRSAWWPALEASAAALPRTVELTGGELRWDGPSPSRLAEDRFLSLVVDPDYVGDLGQASDLQLELGRRSFRLRSWIGFLEFGYPKDVSIATDAVEARAWWGAWSPMILAAVVIVSSLSTLAVWRGLAFVYSLPLRFLAVVFGRELSWASGRRMAGAALVPGGVLMALALVLYSGHRIGLLGLVVTWGLHWLVGWALLLGGIAHLPAVSAVSPARGNPFATEAVSKEDKNPFRG